MSTKEPDNGPSGMPLYQGSTYHDNTRQAVITVTEDKLRRYLTEFCVHAAIKMAWLTPLGILIAVVTTFGTTNFVNRWGLTADTWAAVFLMLGLGSIIWLFYSVYVAFRFWKKADVEHVLQRVKNGSE